MIKMAKYAQWSKLTTQPGQRDAVVGHALEMAALARSVPGCQIFAVCISPGEQATVWLFEMFDDRESHDALGALDQAAELGRRTMTLLAGPPEQAGLTVAGGKGVGAG